MCDIGVVVGDADECRIAAGFTGQLNVRDTGGIYTGDGHGGILYILSNFRLLFFRYGGDDLQLGIGIVGDHAGGNGCGQAVQSSGVGNNHALYVFQNVT